MKFRHSSLPDREFLVPDRTPAKPVYNGNYRLPGCHQLLALLGLLLFPLTTIQAANWDPLLDSGQTSCFDDQANLLSPCPEEGQAFYGQDGNYPHFSLSYLDNGDGTVTDQNTGLTWQQRDDDNDYYADEAEQYCADLELGGHTDWRVPEIFELISLVDYERDFKLIDPVFPMGTYENHVYRSRTEEQGGLVTWSLDFGNGHTVCSSCEEYPEDESNRVRCVRGDATPLDQCVGWAEFAKPDNNHLIIALCWAS